MKEGIPDRIDITENNIVFLLKFIRFIGHHRPEVFAEMMREFEELGGKWMIEKGICPEGKSICNIGYACDACPHNEDLKGKKDGCPTEIHKT